MGGGGELFLPEVILLALLRLPPMVISAEMEVVIFHQKDGGNGGYSYQ